MPESSHPRGWEIELAELIQRGRDREAVALASRHLANCRAVDPRRQLDEIVPMLTGLVAALDESDLDLPTPCSEFDLRGVLDHMVRGATAFGAAFRGETANGPSPQANLLEAFPAALAEVGRSVHSAGAMERIIASPFGQIPGETLARFVALDGLVHGWDIAVATGQSYEPSEEVVEAVADFAQSAISEEMRGGPFAPPVAPPSDASPLAKIVAFTGRDGRSFPPARGGKGPGDEGGFRE